MRSGSRSQFLFFPSDRLLRRVNGSHRIELSRPMGVFKSMGLAAIIVLSGTAADIRAQQPARFSPRGVPGELIIKFKRNSSAAARGQARRAIAATTIAALTRYAAAAGEGTTELARIPPGVSLQALLARLRADAAVQYAEPNWIYTRQSNEALFA